MTDRMTRLLVIMGILLLVGGCVARAPSTIPVSGARHQEVEHQLDRLVCPVGVAMDAKLILARLGREKRFQAALELERHQGRLTLLDPLGRPLILAVLRGAQLTVVDTRREVAFGGNLHSKTMADYLPPGLGMDELYWLVCGCGRLPGSRLTAVREGRDGRWGILEYRGYWHHLLLGPQGDVVQRHLVVNARDEVVLKAEYGAYAPKPCHLPTVVALSGPDLPATLTLEKERLFSCAPLPANRFLLAIPPHYARKTLP